MARQSRGKLNQLKRQLPEGLLAILFGSLRAAIRHRCAASMRRPVGWSIPPAARRHRRRRGAPPAEPVVLSLQLVLRQQLVVGGRTAFNPQGYAHYLTSETAEVHLHGPAHPPSWLDSLPLWERFVYQQPLSLR
jgi:hypothetical protein